jgi:hypothetical protein
MPQGENNGLMKTERISSFGIEVGTIQEAR